MQNLFKTLIKILLLIGAVVAVVRLLEMFRGDPAGVGDEGFSFELDEDDDPYAVDESTLGGEVNPDLLARLVCPLDKGPLELDDGKWLVNPRNGYRYPITDGIPVMLVEVGQRYQDQALIADGEAETEALSANGAG